MTTPSAYWSSCIGSTCVHSWLRSRNRVSTKWLTGTSLRWWNTRLRTEPSAARESSGADAGNIPPANSTSAKSWCVRRSCSKCSDLELPKSTNLAVSTLPRRFWQSETLIITFAGLMSMCTTPSECSWHMPSRRSMTWHTTVCALHPACPSLHTRHACSTVIHPSWGRRNSITSPTTRSGGQGSVGSALVAALLAALESGSGSAVTKPMRPQVQGRRRALRRWNISLRGRSHSMAFPRRRASVFSPSKILSSAGRPSTSISTIRPYRPCSMGCDSHAAAHAGSESWKVLRPAPSAIADTWADSHCIASSLSRTRFCSALPSECCRGSVLDDAGSSGG
mmetsp:Transcript_11455/g.26956  ORF Transcript_11455/g.26956 Transcript_11455/m.26956 type:complete len:337 (-) Transcript_11455:389-1399(-)